MYLQRFNGSTLVGSFRILADPMKSARPWDDPLGVASGTASEKPSRHEFFWSSEAIFEVNCKRSDDSDGPNMQDFLLFTYGLS